MNREDLDACTNRPSCTASEHVLACPSSRRAALGHAELGDHTGDWVVYDYDNGPYAMALYTNAGAAAQHAAQQGYGRVGFWPYGTEFRDAISRWEGRSDELAENQLQAAYERGWRDACDDHLDQDADPTHPIGERYQQPYDPQAQRVLRKAP